MAGTSGPGTGGRGLSRWLFAPWTLAIIWPLVIVTTVFWGLTATLLATVSQRLAHHCGTAWAWLLARASLVRVVVTGRELAPAGQSFVILTNHQGAYDILALYGYLRRQFRWVMKAELRRIPFLGWACQAIGHIFVDRGNSRAAVASLDAARSKLQDGVSVLIFPEGTRSVDGRLLPFKKGGFVMARQLGLPILPVSISGSAQVLPPRCLFPRPGTIRVALHPPVDPMAFDDLSALMAAVRETISAGIRDPGPDPSPEPHQVPHQVPPD